MSSDSQTKENVPQDGLPVLTSREFKGYLFCFRES